MSNVNFGDKVGSKHMCFMVNEDKEMHCAYYSLIEGNGRMMTIKDDMVAVGPKIMQAETRYKASKKAKDFLKRMKAEDSVNED